MKVRNLEFLGYPGYEVSDEGNVWSLNYGRTGERRMMKPTVDQDGYYRVVLCNNGKRKNFGIHQLVLKAFKGDWSMWGLQINHKNEVKTDNRLENIEWCDCRYNINWGTRTERVAKKKSRKVNQYTMDGEFIQSFNSVKEASKITGVTHIDTCCRGERKTAGNFIWRYA